MVRKVKQLSMNNKSGILGLFRTNVFLFHRCFDSVSVFILKLHLYMHYQLKYSTVYSSTIFISFFYKSINTLNFVHAHPSLLFSRTRPTFIDKMFFILKLLGMKKPLNNIVSQCILTKVQTPI